MDHEERIKEERKVWKQRVLDFKSSEDSVSEFAKKLGISVHQFYYWRKKFIKEEKVSPARTKISEPPSNLVRIISRHENSSGLPDPAWLAKFIKALHETH